MEILPTLERESPVLAAVVVVAVEPVPVVVVVPPNNSGFRGVKLMAFLKPAAPAEAMAAAKSRVRTRLASITKMSITTSALALSRSRITFCAKLIWSTDPRMVMAICPL